jgi:cytochrome c553
MKTTVNTTTCILLIALLPCVAAAIERPGWAYGPEQAGEAVARAPDDGKSKQAPGSARSYTQAEIDDPMHPPDWFPGEHPPMPRVVAYGNGTTVRACIGCHLANGHGHPENSRLPGSTSAYLARQLVDFRSGARAGVAAKIMIGIAKGMTEDEIRASSDYFAGLELRRWTKVVETEIVPKTYYRGNRRLPLAEGGGEPIGNRIIEVPEDPARNALRDPHSGNISYVPVGILARGEALVATGAGKTIPCAICHGPALRGIGDVPGIAGQSPITVARQLYDMQSGDRRGGMAALMTAVVENLGPDDILAICAYVASRDP